MKDTYCSEKVPKVYLNNPVPSKRVLQGSLFLRNDGMFPREREQINTFCRDGKKIPGLCEWLLVMTSFDEMQFFQALELFRPYVLVTFVKFYKHKVLFCLQKKYSIDQWEHFIFFLLTYKLNFCNYVPGIWRNPNCKTAKI